MRRKKERKRNKKGIKRKRVRLLWTFTPSSTFPSKEKHGFDFIRESAPPTQSQSKLLQI
jgi:hypothetical protein